MEKLLAAFTTLVATLMISGTKYSIYVPKDTVTLAAMVDAGMPWPANVATCPLRINSDCQTKYGLGQYEYTDFGVILSPSFLPIIEGGERIVIFPPLGKVAAGCVESFDFSACTMSTCSAKLDTCQKFGRKNPFTVNLDVRKCVRRNTKRGFGDCRFKNGSPMGEMLIYNIAETKGKCEKVAVPVDAEGRCYVIAGDRPEDY